MITEDPLEYMYCLLISYTQLREVDFDFSVVTVFIVLHLLNFVII